MKRKSTKTKNKENPMLTRQKLEHHISHLREQHEDLESRLKKGAPEYIERVLKKEKLQIKDEIRKFEEKLASLS
jgi:hypothetical protein